MMTHFKKTLTQEEDLSNKEFRVQLCHPSHPQPLWWQCCGSRTRYRRRHTPMQPDESKNGAHQNGHRSWLQPSVVNLPSSDVYWHRKSSNATVRPFQLSTGHNKFCSDKWHVQQWSQPQVWLGCTPTEYPCNSVHLLLWLKPPSCWFETQVAVIRASGYHWCSS